MIFAITEESWVKIAIAIFTMSSAPWAIPWFRGVLRSRKERRMGRAVEAAHQVYGCLGVIRRDTGASRVLVMKCENGGGMPSPTSRRFVSVLFEERDSDLPSIEHEFQRQPVDAEYSALLARVYAETHVTLVAKKMKKGTMLKTLYDAQGVARTEIALIGIVPDKAVIYVAMNYAESSVGPDGGTLTDQERETIRGSLLKLKSAFNMCGDMLTDRRPVTV